MAASQRKHEALMSLLDNDLYKFTMQHAVLKHYKRDIPVVYQFTNREKDLRLNAAAVQWLKKQIKGKIKRYWDLSGLCNINPLIRYGTPQINRS